jgi:arabinofuranosyltransferase
VKNRKIVLFVVSLTGISVIAFLRSHYLYSVLVDDSFIFFRYAENIVNGHGFVWNVGEQPVEGYSSFLYLVIFIFGKLLSFNPEILSIVIGIICSSFTLYLTFLIYQHLNPKLISENIFTVFIIGITPSFLYWSVAGMETAFYSMFLLLAFYFFLTRPDDFKSNLFNGILFGFLCLIRFEATLFFLFSLIYLLKDKNHLFKFHLSRQAIIFTIGYSIIFISYFTWRWIYFGQFFPNTFYAKTGGGLLQILGGLKYTISSFRLLFGFGWILILLIFVFFRFKMLRGKPGFLFSIGIISILTTIFVGGDHFYGGRFILPVLPLLLVVLPPSINKFLKINPFKNFKETIILSLLSFIMIGILIPKFTYVESYRGLINLVEGKKENVIVYDTDIKEHILEWQHGFILMGKELNKIAKPQDYIAAIPIGAIGYYSGVGVIDMVGIVDPVIAKEYLSIKSIKKWIPGHTKGDGDYILSRRPKYIQLVDVLTKKLRKKPFDNSFNFKSIREIWNSPEFHKDYEFRSIKVLDGWYYNLFVRRDSL